MTPSDIIVLIAIFLIVGGAVAYIVKAKRDGKKCIGCPDSATCKGIGGCGGNCSSCNSCHSIDAQNSKEEK